jgi:hypothetical protein
MKELIQHSERNDTQKIVTMVREYGYQNIVDNAVSLMNHSNEENDLMMKSLFTMA